MGLNKNKIDIVANFLTEYGLSEEYSEMSKESLFSVFMEMLKLRDDKGKLIFPHDEKYHFTSDAHDIIEKASARAINDLNDVSDLLNEGDIERVKRFIDIIKEMILNEKEYETRRRYSFATIPKVLEGDILGKNTKSEGELFSPPHNNFTNGNMREFARYMLSELEKIESILGSEVITNVLRNKGDGIKSEDNGVFVKKNVSRKTRIQIYPYDNTYFIIGIFYKAAKGFNSDKDDEVQKQYKVRKDAVSRILANNPSKIGEYEISYEEFKAKLINMAYGTNMTVFEALKQIIFNIVYEKMINKQ